MKLLPQFCFAVSAAALMVLALPAPQAHAFTFEGANAVTPDGSANLKDPDSRFEDSDKGKMDLGNGSSLHFGSATQPSPGASFDADANRLLSPMGRPGESGRFR
ncbi:MAG: hypothetical protein WA792_12465 [Pseudolabrys sp.]|jgi:hypothetical protein